MSGTTRPQTRTGDQWLRWISLRVGPKGGGDGIDLSELRIVFRVTSPIISTPNALVARIYNLSDTTVGSLLQFNPSPPPGFGGTGTVPGTGTGQVLLDAGYENGQRGNIFTGEIVQVRAGRENQTDTYVDIYGQDGDSSYLYTVLNETIAKGHKPEDQRLSIAKAFEQHGTTAGSPLNDSLPQNPAPRGKSFYGMARDYASDLARDRHSTWTFDRGELVFIPYDKYRQVSGEAIVISPATGMVGMPELTQVGLQVRCLLNPAIAIGTRIKIDNRLLTSDNPRGPGLNTPPYNLQREQFASPQNLLLFASADGIYKVLQVEHSGDTRGNPWYTDSICISVDPTAAPPQVQSGIGIPL